MEPKGNHEIEQAVGLDRNSYCGLVSLTFFYASRHDAALIAGKMMSPPGARLLSKSPLLRQ